MREKSFPSKAKRKLKKRAPPNDPERPQLLKEKSKSSHSKIKSKSGHLGQIQQPAKLLPSNVVCWHQN